MMLLQVSKGCVSAAHNTPEAIEPAATPAVGDISSESHPFYTGTQKIMDTAGRVEKFYRKYGFKRPDDEEGEES